MMTDTSSEAFVIFQYSNGVGHLARCSTIANALSTIAHVTMFSGGQPVKGYLPPSGVDFVQLPAIRWERSTDALPVPIEAGRTKVEIEALRSEVLVENFLRRKPRIVVIEYFPFAPKRFGETTLNKLFEVINKEQERPTVICSIRTYPRLWEVDVDPAWINERLRRDFSCVLHHTDTGLFPLASLGPYLQTALSGVTVWQTGFVRRPFTQKAHGAPSHGLLLTVGGGGALHAMLLKRWINAARAGSPDLLPVNAVCGPLMGADDRKLVREEQDATVTVHDQVANMDELISSSRAVVCLGGYNTLVEALSLGKPVLAFPHGELGDQAFQASALHAQGMLLMGNQSLGEDKITALMNKLLHFKPRHPIDCNGADRSIEIIKQLLSAGAERDSISPRS